MIGSIVMIINKLSKEYEPLLTACMLYFFRLKDFFILNYEVNLFVAKNFILIFAYYYLPACNKMNIAPRKRAQIVTLRQHSNITIRKIGEKLNVSKSNMGRIFFKWWIPMVTSPQLKGGISMNESLKRPLVMTKCYCKILLTTLEKLVRTFKEI